MDISTDHSNAVIAACRIPALDARLALLVQPNPGNIERSSIAFYDTTYPATPGDPPGASPIVTISMTAGAGVVNQGLFQLQLDVPIEAQVDGADPANGTVPQWARITTYDGFWWADVTVTVEGGAGEIQLVQTGTDGGGQPEARLFNGAFARLASAVVQG